MRIDLSKVGVLIALLLTLTLSIHADSRFILSGAKMIDPRAISKIDEMGSELFAKTGINVYIYAKESYSHQKFPNTGAKIEFIKGYEQNITKDLKPPFVVLTMSLEDTHLNLIESKDIKGIVDKDDILDRYIIPLLASKDKNSLYAKVSAGLFNGYASIVESIAEARNVELKSSIGNAGVMTSTIWRVLMYTIIVIGLILYTIAVLKSKK